MELHLRVSVGLWCYLAVAEQRLRGTQCPNRFQKSDGLGGGAQF